MSLSNTAGSVLRFRVEEWALRRGSNCKYTTQLQTRVSKERTPHSKPYITKYYIESQTWTESLAHFKLLKIRSSGELL